MTTKTASKMSSSKPAPKSPVVAKRTATGRTLAEAAAKLDFKGLAKEAAEKMKAAKAAAPAAAPAPAPKAEPKKAAKGKREVIPGDAKITVVAKENPRRAGLAAKTFALYKTGMTVAAWRDLCRERNADLGYLHADIRAGYITVK